MDGYSFRSGVGRAAPIGLRHIVRHKGRIVAVDGAGGVEQHGPQVLLDVADFGGVVPQAVHIETVCALSKLDIYQKITVNLKMDELDVTAAETKATYEEIREYVKEHTGLNVSDLYIAQVKQKCGIKERQNYNKPKAENPKRLKCPAEKERAIREVLKYFKMI